MVNNEKEVQNGASSQGV